ncbi:hypothetical protein FRC19_000574 [Serendipita sp. 401]|nr:hypothetical protein FRC19_000574 [Serendipita sp. 401]KAG8830008.1 hypothetical protein FRC18_008759 [Serendipita sp. 400]KAG8863907.1 hypothetical protein FRC20_010470 [Serendipita sp. 405]KAG9052233.1 hypothetical protein FS842_010285 [Serendipita sp. 407]
MRFYKLPSGVAHHLERSEEGLEEVARVLFKWDRENFVTNPKVPGAHSITPPLGHLATQDTWVEDNVYICPVMDCKAKFLELDRLRKHLDSQFHRTDKRTYHCPSCKSHFPVISAALQHMEKGCDNITHDNTKDKYMKLLETLRSLWYNR